MSKQPKANLRDIIAGNTPSQPVAELAPARSEPAADVTTADVVTLTPNLARTAKPKGQGTLRERARQLSLYLEEPVYEQLRELAFTERKKAHPLILEGLDLLFKKRGLLPISELLRRSGH